MIGHKSHIDSLLRNHAKSDDGLTHVTILATNGSLDELQCMCQHPMADVIMFLYSLHNLAH